jgi:hypothetical protein
VTRPAGRAWSGAAGPVTSLRSAGDAGMVTAEFAVALPAFVLVVLAALSGVAVMTSQLRCVDAADIAARMVARGDTSSLVREAALGGAPNGAELVVVKSGSLVTATVRARLSPPGLAKFLPGIEVQAHVTDVLEPPAPTASEGGSG